MQPSPSESRSLIMQALLDASNASDTAVLASASASSQEGTGAAVQQLKRQVTVLHAENLRLQVQLKQERMERQRLQGNHDQLLALVCGR